MRQPKKGDRCEFAVFSHVTYKRERPCNVRHLEGTPPGQLMPVRNNGQHTLLCSTHNQSYGSTAVRKQRPKKTDSAQESLI